jgi:hypothetical protein
VICPDWLDEDEGDAAAAGDECRRAGLATLTYSPSPAMRTSVRPPEWVATLRAAVAWLRGESGVDGQRIAVLGVGPLAGGVALIAAADDPWIRAVCVRNPILDGRSWLRRRSGLDDTGWRQLTEDAATRLRMSTVDGSRSTVPLFLTGAGEPMDLVTFDHLCRLRADKAVTRSPAERLRITGAGCENATGDLQEDVVWLLNHLHFSPYEVSIQTLVSPAGRLPEGTK